MHDWPGKRSIERYVITEVISFATFNLLFHDKLVGLNVDRCLRFPFTGNSKTKEGICVSKQHPKSFKVFSCPLSCAATDISLVTISG